MNTDGKLKAYVIKRGSTVDFEKELNDWLSKNKVNILNVYYQINDGGNHSILILYKEEDILL
jgi:hypothetical protein